jgi:hypothetical protein
MTSGHMVTRRAKLIAKTASARPALIQGLFERFHRPIWPRTRRSLNPSSTRTSGTMNAML